jgi:serine/threonine protein kinase
MGGTQKDSAKRKRLQKLIFIFRFLKHPNIIKFEAMCLQSPNLCLLTELMERGSLGEVLAVNADLNWTRKLSFAKDTAEGLAYLHRNGMIHRDVKSSNLVSPFSHFSFFTLAPFF